MLFHALGNALLTPPGLPFVLLVAGMIVRGRWRRGGLVLVVTGTVVLGMLSVPAVATRLLASLEIYPPLPAHGPPGPPGPGAIVVLAAGRYPYAPEYGAHGTVNGDTLVRLRYGAFLYRRTHLPILVSGGTVYHGGPPEAVLMRDVLEHDFSVPVRWVEGRSRDTFQNARDSARLLHTAHLREVYLVTQAWHMRRAVAAFANTGIRVIPAPTGFTGIARMHPSWLSFVPSAYAMEQSAEALHEYAGLAWYRLGGQ
ncbi:MAG: YdcF family protein [Acidiferrobacteraceae bacterium]